MNGRFRPSNTTGLPKAEAHAFSVAGPPNQQLAMQLVHSTEYHLWKGKIMRPIDEFAAHASTRLINKVHALSKALCCCALPTHCHLHMAREAWSRLFSLCFQAAVTETYVGPVPNDVSGSVHFE